MHLPAALRRRIVYAIAASLLVGGITYGVRAGSPAKPNPEKPVAVTKAATFDTMDAQRVAQDMPAPAAGKATPPVVKGKQEPKPKVSTYKVVEGDTLGTIAAQFGLKSTTILWANDLSESELLQIDQELKIPALDGTVHTITPGDTLFGVALEYDVDVAAIVAANADVDASALQPGQVLLVPGGEPIVRRLASMVASRGGERQAASASAFGQWPVEGPVTDWFGWRTHPVYGTRHYHDGIDIGVGMGTPVASVGRGRVSYVGYLGGYGLTIKVDHGDGLVTMYSHLSKAGVEPGQVVGGGEQVGLSGNTGTSTGPHLHFSVFVGGSPVDPATWLP